MIVLGIVSLLAVVISWVVCRRFETGYFPASIDHPNERSLHQSPVSRNGGVAILAGLLAGSSVLMLAQDLQPWLAALPGAALLVLVALIDDHNHVDPRWRLIAQFLAILSLLLMTQQSWFAPQWVHLTWLVFVGCWAINLYNFMDGMDGFAGSMSFIGFAGLAVLAYLNGLVWLATLCVLIVASVGGFLLRNWPPAKLFMGDVGSTLLGFLAFASSLWLVNAAPVPFWVPLLIFSPFWIDATVTLVRRALRGEKVWQAHREHYYQRLVLMGWGHRKTLVVEIVLMLATTVSAVLGTFFSLVGQIWVVIVWMMVYVIILTVFSIYEGRHNSL